MNRRYDMVEQVLFDILLYLPIMSLLRFKSVCKSWFSIIESSTFIIEHFNYNNDKEDNIIISRHHHVLDISPSSENKMLQLFMLSGSQYENCVDINFEQLLWHPAKEVEFIGSCKGIICLYHSISSDVALWNPALKQLRSLPQPSFPCRNSSHFIAFGTDATNDFKVLRISLFYSKKIYGRGEEVVMLGNQAEVYNLRDNSWRITHKNDDLFFTMNPSSLSESKSTGGECFWISHDHDYFPMLLWFDFNDEVFGTTAVPDVDSDDDFDYYLDNCDDKLVCIRAETGYDVYEIWILHKNGVNESWNKLYNTGSLSHLGSVFPLGLSKNAEFFICLKFGDGDPKLYLYNLHTGEGQFLPYVVYGHLIHCNASLFSVKSANGV